MAPPMSRLRAARAPAKSHRRRCRFGAPNRRARVPASVAGSPTSANGGHPRRAPRYRRSSPNLPQKEGARVQSTAIPLSMTAAPLAARPARVERAVAVRSEEHTSELQSLMRISYAVFCLKKKTQQNPQLTTKQHKHAKHET